MLVLKTENCRQKKMKTLHFKITPIRVQNDERSYHREPTIVKRTYGQRKQGNNNICQSSL